MGGKLIPNTELGHVYLKGQEEIAEKFAADSARKREGLSWEEWGTRFNVYLQHIDRLLSPDLVILGGGASKHFAKYEHCLHVAAKVRPSIMKNIAGIIGAAACALPNKK